MKKLLTALFLLAGIATAQAEVTGNFGVVSDYRYRGISQTQNSVAVQGGVDYTHASGFYAGNWNSSVSSQLYTNGSGIESDLYAGFKKEIFGVTVDIGTLNYFYAKATNGTSNDFDTNEVYIGLTYGPVAVKRSQSLSNYFGVANSKNSTYDQADVTIPVTEKIALVAHVGRTSVENSPTLNYTDYKVGATYDLNGYVLSASYYTNKAKASGVESANTVNGERLYKDAIVVGFTKSFN